MFIGNGDKLASDEWLNFSCWLEAMERGINNLTIVDTIYDEINDLHIISAVLTREVETATIWKLRTSCK